MKILLVASMMLMLLMTPTRLVAQKSTAQKSETFAAFFLRFKTAVARDDREAVASMTKLPFLLESRELDRAGFIKRYRQLFDRKVKRCFANGKTIRDGDSFSLFCGETIFLFGKVEGQYRFLEIGVND
ncbi:MAG TPA: hypothetical protein VGB73_01575 [Pyrinomonadaceae bacterium]|jgi:hypothetical protein